MDIPKSLHLVPPRAPRPNGEGLLNAPLREGTSKRHEEALRTAIRPRLNVEYPLNDHQNRPN
jgi:hypothetical protein